MARALTKLTNDSVRRFKGPGVLWGTDPTGFGCAYNATGGNSWLVKYKTKWQRFGRVDLMPLEEARAKAKQILADLEAGIDRKAIAEAATKAAAEAKLRDKTFGEALDDYCKCWVDPQKAEPIREYSAALYQRMARTHLADWLDTPLRSITGPMVKAKYESILADVQAREAATAKKAGREPDPRKTGAGSANLVARVLSLVWNHARDEMELELPTANPTHKLRRHRRKLGERNDHVALADVKAFVEAVKGLGAGKIDCPERDAILLCLFTGLRRGNACRLRWDQVDWKNSVIRIDGAEMKSTRRFALPLNELALGLLRERFAKPAFPGSRFVFARYGGDHITELARAIDAATKAAGIAHVSPHGLRRSHATICYAAGLTMEQTALMLDHARPVGTTAKYVQGFDEKMRAWAATVGGFIADRIGTGPGGNVVAIRPGAETVKVAAVDQAVAAMPA